MSKVKSFSIPAADSNLNELIAQAAQKHNRSESWVICQALKYYFSNGESVVSAPLGTTEAALPADPSSLPPVEAPKVIKPKNNPSLDAKDFINFE